MHCSISDLISRAIDLCQNFSLAVPRLLDRPGNRSDEHAVCSMIAGSCAMSSDSCLLLLRHERVWDADIIVRAVYEGTAKLCYLTDGQPDERAIRLNEYWNDVPASIRAKRSDRVEKILSVVSNRNEPQWKGLAGIMVGPEEAVRLRSQYPREQQRQLLHRWSFHEIIGSLAKSDDPAFQNLVMLSHGYGNGSHLSHQDWNGVGMIWERTRREPLAQEAVHNAHIARILFDLCAMALLRSHCIAKISGGEDSGVTEGWSVLTEFYKCTSKVANRWAELEYGLAASDASV